MYSLAILPAARQDMVDIARYIGHTLGNPAAADRPAEVLVAALEGIPHFPYANPAYAPLRPLRREYRKLSVENYLILYWVDEARRQVTVARVIYAGRDYGNLLD